MASMAQKGRGLHYTWADFLDDGFKRDNDSFKRGNDGFKRDNDGFKREQTDGGLLSVYLRTRALPHLNKLKDGGFIPKQTNEGWVYT